MLRKVQPQIWWRHVDACSGPTGVDMAGYMQATWIPITIQKPQF